MFRRRQAQSMLSRVRNILWPERGFRRVFSYLVQRVARMPGSPLSISIGIACGVAVSFTPFIGFHLLLGAFLAYLLRGNLLASVIGSVIGNPWTFPLIYTAAFKIGSWALGKLGSAPASTDISIADIIAHPAELLAFFLPLTVGGLIMGTIAWFASFGMAYWALTGWREHRAKRLAAGRQRRSQSRSSSPVFEDHSDTTPVNESRGEEQVPRHDNGDAR